MPDPVGQFELRDGAGYFVARVDFAYPSAKLVIEIDGYAYHSGRPSFDLDRRRQNRIVELGWTPLRFSSRMIAERPSEVVAIVARALASPNHREGG